MDQILGFYVATGYLTYLGILCLLLLALVWVYLQLTPSKTSSPSWEPPRGACAGMPQARKKSVR